jgi:hypothetical protein
MLNKAKNEKKLKQTNVLQSEMNMECVTGVDPLKTLMQTFTWKNNFFIYFSL